MIPNTKVLSNMESHLERLARQFHEVTTEQELYEITQEWDDIQEEYYNLTGTYYEPKHL